MVFNTRRGFLPAAAALILTFPVTAVCRAYSQDDLDPVRWTIKVDSGEGEIRAGGEFSAQLVAAIDEGWHLYSTDQPPGGPLPTRIRLIEGQPFKLSGEVETPLPRISFDTNFNMDTQIFEGEAVFTLPVTVMADTPAGEHTLSVAATFQTCNETKCLPPKTVKATAELKVLAAPKAVSGTRADGARAERRGEAALQAGVAAPGALSEGMQVPDFAFTDFDGRERKFSEFRGRIVLIDFWATWCKPCLAEIPHLKQLYERYKGRGFEILGMDSETLTPDEEEADPEFAREAHERAKAIVTTRGATWTHATSETAVPLAVKVFGVKTLPTKFLVDREGKVIRRLEEGAELDEVLTTVLGGNK